MKRLNQTTKGQVTPDFSLMKQGEITQSRSGHRRRWRIGGQKLRVDQLRARDQERISRRGKPSLVASIVLSPLICWQHSTAEICKIDTPLSMKYFNRHGSFLKPQQPVFELRHQNNRFTSGCKMMSPLYGTEVVLAYLIRWQWMCLVQRAARWSLFFQYWDTQNLTKNTIQQTLILFNQFSSLVFQIPPHAKISRFALLFFCKCCCKVTFSKLILPMILSYVR